MDYKIYTTEKFDREFEKLSKEEQKRINKIFLQLKENPWVGDQLQIKSLREKRLTKKRIYYIVFDDLKCVLVVAISDKKTQQDTIDYILRDIEKYKIYLENLLRKL